MIIYPESSKSYDYSCEGSIFKDNPIQNHPKKAMILAGRGEIFNDNPIQSDLKAMIVAGRGSISMIILSGAF